MNENEHKEIMRRAVARLREISADRNVRALYEFREKMLKDYDFSMQAATDRGTLKKALAVVTSLLEQQIPMDVIMKATDLTLNEIEGLRQVCELREQICREYDFSMQAAEDKGVQKKTRAVAKSLLEQQTPMEVIMKATGMSREEIERLHYTD